MGLDSDAAHTSLAVRALLLGGVAIGGDGGGIADTLLA